jgi:hypothetical protein
MEGRQKLKAGNYRMKLKINNDSYTWQNGSRLIGYFERQVASGI